MGWYLFALLCGAVVADMVVQNRDSGEPLVIKTHNEPFACEHVASTPVEHPLYRNATTSFYASKDITLYPGEAWFSLPDVSTLNMPQPGQPYAIIAVKYDIVEAGTFRSVPLTEMYSHHWLVYDKLVGSDGFSIGCGGPDTFVSNIYGAGGEMRGVHYVYPEGFGHVIPSNRHWSANMHFIRTEDLSTERYNGSIWAAKKACVECEYAPGKGVGCIPGLGGTAIFGCCFDGSRCPVNNPKDKTSKKYNLVYNITWTTDVETIKPLRTYVIDVFGCLVTENLFPNKKTTNTECDDKLCISKQTRTMPVSGTIQWAYCHQHIGAVNTTLSVNGIPVCTSYPHIGTDPHDTPGNEEGYAVGFRMCVDPALDKPIKVNKGDALTVTALASVDSADTRFLPFPGGKHNGFMGLFYFFFHEDGDADSYTCVNDKCSPGPGGLPLKTCQEACGGPTPPSPPPSPPPAPPAPPPAPPSPPPSPPPAPPAPPPAPPSPPLPPTPSQCSIQKGMNNHGHNLKRVRGAKSTEACCTACVNMAGCAGFTFVHYGSQCWLKDRIDTPVADAAVDSGVPSGDIQI